MGLKTHTDFGKGVGNERWLGRDLTLFPKGKPYISPDNTTINNNNNNNNDIAKNLVGCKRTPYFSLT